MALIAALVVSWLLIACAVAWALGRASDVERLVEVQQMEPATAPRTKRSYSTRKLPGKVIGPNRRRASSFAHPAPSRSLH